jgi:hypothetical protein
VEAAGFSAAKAGFRGAAEGFTVAQAGSPVALESFTEAQEDLATPGDLAAREDLATANSAPADLAGSMEAIGPACIMGAAGIGAMADGFGTEHLS